MKTAVDKRDQMSLMEKILACLSQLDDWVLCRVRQKGNMSKNTWEDQETPSKLESLPKLEELPSVHASVNTEINTYWPFKDCPILTSMLAGQFPPSEAFILEPFIVRARITLIVQVISLEVSSTHQGKMLVKKTDNMLITSARHYFDQSQPQGNIFSPTPATAIMNLQELNEPAFFREDFYRPNLSSN
ncbi:hypothetical protein RJ639_014062 [Escallonia herrerae]|uniref:Uncharacterized protein n=1 Tax=Escallonia herrerae TaxID=1293975 RepID=A0AA88VI40_9ASTE|nr:hypothetical protein RJ639_014062 [Escallonia herrerae]